MTTDQEVDIFLEHFGKKGMKWGVRKTKATFGSKNPNQKRNLKRAGAVAAVGAVGVGALFAKSYFSKAGTNRLPKVSQLKPSNYYFQSFGPKGSIQAGRHVTTETLNMLVKNL